ncbi:MAG: hypothetical protein CR986_10530 [Ignavibacteriae bacterium]|nr:MAG: hypothetical protein CR986_10530 [Ignavibacteriota bacterium]
MVKIFSLFLLIQLSLFAQELNINIVNFSGKATLHKIEGEKLTFIDSLDTDNNSISYVNKNLKNGLYKIIFAHNKWLNIVYDGKNIKLKTDYKNILDSLKILKSESNKLYYKFLKLNKDYKTKTELLNIIITHYPKEDDYYKATQTKLASVQKEYDNFINIESQENPKLFIARYIKSAQLPIIPQKISQQEQLNFLKNNSLKNVNFDDIELINSDVFANKSIEYLTYFRNPQLPKELLEQKFMKAVDTLLHKAKINIFVYQHLTEYLIDGFKKFGFDKIIDYIVENYVVKDDLCLDETLENSIEKRIEQSKILAKGRKVPNILMPDKNGKVYELFKSNSEKTLLVFYSSECPHCKELLPKLKEISTNVEIIAISLDTKREDWLNFVEKNKLNFTNINDPNGWNGDLATDFYIYATPTMFLLDKDKKIIAKPTKYIELLKHLKN